MLFVVSVTPIALAHRVPRCTPSSSSHSCVDNMTTQGHSYASLPVVESNSNAHRRRSRAHYIVLALLLITALAGLFSWATIRRSGCEHCSAAIYGGLVPNHQIQMKRHVANHDPDTVNATSPAEGLASNATTHGDPRGLPLRTSTAPPYQDACTINDHCDWGYRCIEGACYGGCDEDRDCLRPQYCRRWYAPGKPSDKYCLVSDHRACKAHLEFCRTDSECCSGNCPRKGFWRMCQPSKGRLREVVHESSESVDDESTK